MHLLSANRLLIGRTAPECIFGHIARGCVVFLLLSSLSLSLPFLFLPHLSFAGQHLRTICLQVTNYLWRCTFLFYLSRISNPFCLFGFFFLSKVKILVKHQTLQTLNRVMASLVYVWSLEPVLYDKTSLPCQLFSTMQCLAILQPTAGQAFDVKV